MRYVTLKKLAEITGYSEKALRSKIERGDFAQGYHYVRSPDGRIHFDTEKYEEWVANKPAMKGSRHAATA